jgi:hypothetical protein
MKQEFFKSQIARLQIRFGEKNLDPEFIQLIWREVHDMSDAGFTRFCDVLIGSRTSNKPPLLSDFREARLAEQKLKFQNEAVGAARAFENGPKKNLSEVLSGHFGKVGSIAEAIEVAKLKLLKDDDSGPKGAA